ncbi:hypothetical protein HYS50_03425 [Candidatus Woesearchaeota archaeon]|nr:hypothetical protein [Candidatus Woesearchaeota archaeon]
MTKQKKAGGTPSTSLEIKFSIVPAYPESSPDDIVSFGLRRMAIYTSIPDEIAKAASGKTVSLSKKKGGCFFELQDFASHNQHMSLFASDEEAATFQKRIEADVIAILKEVGYHVEPSWYNEEAPASPTPPVIINQTINTQKQAIHIGDFVKYNGNELCDSDCSTIDGEQIGKIAIINTALKKSIGVDFMTEFKIGSHNYLHDILPAIPTETGWWLHPTCLEIISEEKICFDCQDWAWYGDNGNHMLHLKIEV